MAALVVLTLCGIVKADVDRMAKEQNLPVFLMGLTCTGSCGATDRRAQLATQSKSGCVGATVMSQILFLANNSL